MVEPEMPPKAAINDAPPDDDNCGRRGRDYRSWRTLADDGVIEDAAVDARIGPDGDFVLNDDAAKMGHVDRT